MFTYPYYIIYIIAVHTSAPCPVVAPTAAVGVRSAASSRVGPDKLHIYNEQNLFIYTLYISRSRSTHLCPESCRSPLSRRRCEERCQHPRRARRVMYYYIHILYNVSGSITENICINAYLCPVLCRGLCSFRRREERSQHPRGNRHVIYIEYN